MASHGGGGSGGVVLVRTAVFSVFEARRPKGPVPMPSMVLLPAQQLFAALGVDPDLAKRTSMVERQERAGGDWVGEMPLTYGEVTFESLQAVLRRIQHHGGLPTGTAPPQHGPQGEREEGEAPAPAPDGTRGLVFYDLGHGAGGACLAAACLFPFAKVAGIELLHGLHRQSEDNRAVWTKMAASQVRLLRDGGAIATANDGNGTVSGSGQGDGGGGGGGGAELHALSAEELVAARAATVVEFVQGSFLDPTADRCNWPAKADVVLANSVCYSASMMLDLTRLGERLRPGAFFVTSNNRLGSAELPLLETVRLPTSWGTAEFHIHRRR